MLSKNKAACRVIRQAACILKTKAQQVTSPEVSNDCATTMRYVETCDSSFFFLRPKIAALFSKKQVRRCKF